jgi:hypothetical protein
LDLAAVTALPVVILALLVAAFYADRRGLLHRYRRSARHSR